YARRKGTVTLMSATATPSAATPRTGTPVPPRPINEVDARYHALCNEARAAGHVTDHCHGGDCYGTPESVLCECPCEGCVRATGFAEQAEREVMGESMPDTDPRKRRT